MRFIQLRNTESGARHLGWIAQNDDSVVDVTALNPEFDSLFRLLMWVNVREHTVTDWVETNLPSPESTKPRWTLTRLLSTGSETRAEEVLLPIDQPDNPWALQFWGAGVTHRRSAEAREDEARNLTGRESNIYDHIYREGLEGGKPGPGILGSKPEIFFKGNGYQAVAHGGALEKPQNAKRLVPEPEVVAYYLAGADGHPKLAGFAGGNDFSDQGWESINPLYLPHAKVQDAFLSTGPVFVTPDDPAFNLAEIELQCRVIRNGETVLDSGAISTGEKHMAHSLANLTGHLFDHRQIRSDEVRGLFLGTSAVFPKGVEAGDRIDISFGAGLETLSNEVADA